MSGCRVRGIRGATTAAANTREAILEATAELVAAIQSRNGFGVDDIVSALFTATADLDAAFPASAARDAGWQVPLLDAVEMSVPGALPRCVRVLVQVYTARSACEIRHVYLRDAAGLRPDLL